MKRFLFALGLLAGLWLGGRAKAAATTCTVPYTFVPHTTAASAQVNANFAAVLACVNNITASNIGAGGLYASNIIPTSVAQATFGGTQNYTFPQTLVLPGLGTGCVQIASGGLLGVTGANCVTVPVSVAQGGTGVTGGFVNGQCIYYNGSTFASESCSTGNIATITVTAPITLGGTSANPVIGLSTPLATQYGGTGTTGASNAFAPSSTADCIGGAYSGGTGAVTWLPCLTTKSSWNGSAYVVSAQNTAPIVVTGIPFSFSSCSAASGVSQAACQTVSVPLPTTPTAWGYASYSTWTCEAHMEAAGTGTVPLVYTAVISGSNINVSAFNPYSFAISSTFSQTAGAVCQASATHS